MTFKKFFAIILAGVLMFGVLPMEIAFATADNVIYVATNGSDGNPGTMAAPLATLAGAKEKAKLLTGDVTVIFRGGQYNIDTTVEFNSSDKSNVLYKACDGEKVIFTSGIAFTGFEECTVNGVKAFKKNIGKHAPFNVLFNKTTTLKRTRYPESGYLYVDGVDFSDVANPEEARDTYYAYTGFYAKKGDVPDFKNKTDVMLRVLHYWKDEMSTVTSIDTVSGHVTFSRPTSMKIAEDDRYFFENVFEALNEPGEWYLDKSTSELYYIPFEGEKADTLTLWGAVNETMININGVDGISFENIVFRGNGFNIPHNNSGRDLSSQAAYDAPSCVSYSFASGFYVKNCEFRDIAACALFLGDSVKDASVENCIFENIGAQAVYISGRSVKTDDATVSKNIKVTNNLVNGYGRVFFNAVGILVINTNAAEVSHNEIHDGYYTAVSVGWVWGYGPNITYNCKICDNLIYDIGQGWLSDMGGIYVLGVQPGTVISGNVIHNVAADPEQGGYGGWGIYLDEGSSNILVEKNLVYACGSDAYHLHYGADNTIRNNIFALSSDSQIRVCSKYEEHKTADFVNNIILTDGSTPVMSHMENSIALTAENNIFWNLSNPDKILFVRVDKVNQAFSLNSAQRRGFIGENTVVDPQFKDAAEFDFELSETSPVFELGFEKFDYSNAGTLKSSVLGLDTPGGETEYNANSKKQELKKARELFPLINSFFYLIWSMFKNLIKMFAC